MIFATSVAASPNEQDDQLQHGKYIASIAGCLDCHTPLQAEYQEKLATFRPDYPDMVRLRSKIESLDSAINKESGTSELPDRS